MESACGRHAGDIMRGVQCPMRTSNGPQQGILMRKLILMAVAVAGLAAGASAMAQASQYDQATAGGTRPANVPPGTIRGPSGELQYWQGNGGRVPDQRYGNYVYPDGYNRYGNYVYPDGYNRYGRANGYP